MPAPLSSPKRDDPSRLWKLGKVAAWPQWPALPPGESQPLPASMLPEGLPNRRLVLLVLLEACPEPVGTQGRQVALSLGSRRLRHAEKTRGLSRPPLCLGHAGCGLSQDLWVVGPLLASRAQRGQSLLRAATGPWHVRAPHLSPTPGLAPHRPRSGLHDTFLLSTCRPWLAAGEQSLEQDAPQLLGDRCADQAAGARCLGEAPGEARVQERGPKPACQGKGSMGWDNSLPLGTGPLPQFPAQ